MPVRLAEERAVEHGPPPPEVKVELPGEAAMATVTVQGSGVIRGGVVAAW
jgi:hypothetical protein